MTDEQAREGRGACDVCGQLTSIVMGDRGPVRVPKSITNAGHFRFCADCRALAEPVTTESWIRLEWLRMTAGPKAGHRWLVATADLGQS